MFNRSSSDSLAESYTEHLGSQGSSIIHRFRKVVRKVKIITFNKGGTIESGV